MTHHAAERLADRVRTEFRASGAVVAGPAVAAFLLQVLFPMENLWIAFVSAGVLASLFVLLVVLGHRRRRRDGRHAYDAPAGLPRDVVLERSNTLEQFGHAFARAAILLASFGAGAGAGALVGF